MSSTVILVGGPDTGKTNFLARVVAHVRDAKGSLQATRLPDDMRYVEDALAHLLRGEFAPRSHNTIEEVSGEIAIDVRLADGTQEATIAVPDVSGETWDEIAKSAQISNGWLDRVKNANGALLFVRALSELNVFPMDWVNAPKLFAIAGEPGEHQFLLPTQVMLCEFLRMLEENLKPVGDQMPRVAIIVTAYDRLDVDKRAEGPMAFIEDTFPLFAGKLVNSTRLEIGVFGASVVGGELADPSFKDTYLDGDFVDSGYVIDGTSNPLETVSDMARPISWVLGFAKTP